MTPWAKGFADGENGYLKSSDNIVKGARNMSGTFGNFSKGQQDALELLTRMDDGNGDQVQVKTEPMNNNERARTDPLRHSGGLRRSTAHHHPIAA